MKKKLQKFRFNMIEILLALVVMAIGISSILALFSGGLKTAKSARDEDQLSEVVTYILTGIEANLLAGWVVAEDYTVSETGLLANCNDPLFKTEVSDEGKNKIVPYFNSIKISPNSVKEPFITASSTASSKYNSITQISVNNFAYQKNTKDKDGNIITDFSVAVRIGKPNATRDQLNQIYALGFQENESLRNSDSSVNAQKNELTTKNLIARMADERNKLYKVFLVEFSWPADIDYDNRQKRIYRLELFNNKFPI